MTVRASALSEPASNLTDARSEQEAVYIKKKRKKNHYTMNAHRKQGFLVIHCRSVEHLDSKTEGIP